MCVRDAQRDVRGSGRGGSARLAMEEEEEDEGKRGRAAPLGLPGWVSVGAVSPPPRSGGAVRGAGAPAGPGQAGCGVITPGGMGSDPELPPACPEPGFFLGEGEIIDS